MTEGGHRRRTTSRRRGRLSGVPLDQFRAELLGRVSAEVQRCAGIGDVQRTGFGAITVTARVVADEIEVVDVYITHTSKQEAE